MTDPLPPAHPPRIAVKKEVRPLPRIAPTARDVNRAGVARHTLRDGDETTPQVDVDT